MAGGICLPPKAIDSFRQALKTGKIDPEQLANMSSEKRRKVLGGIVGDGNAKFVNTQFETKMLLKNQQQGYLTWAKKLTGVTPEVRRDLISRIRKLDRVLDPTDEKAFLKDLAATRLGFDVTAREAKQITRMSNQLQELEAKRSTNGQFTSEAERMAYGRAKVALGSYLSDLKNQAEKKSLWQQAKNPFEAVTSVSGLAKSLKASLDNSAIFRQGWKTLWTSPKIWQKNARQTFIDIARQMKNQDVLKEISADIVSRPNAERYTKMKLAIGDIEEEFPSSLPERIPLLGRAYKASEAAYTGFLYRTRADVADKYLEIAEKSGVNINDREQLVKIGQLINSLTGRGDIGRFEGTAAQSLNNVFFSVRFMKANFDTLTAHQLQKGNRLGNNDKAAQFVRKQAAVNLLKVVSGTAAVLTIADALKPDSVEWDPRSSDFGKIRIGTTRFDVSAGMGSFVTLAARLATQSTKTSGPGTIKKLNEGFGSSDGLDITFDFFSNKLSPAAAVVRDLIRQEDFKGNTPTASSTLQNLFVPIPFTTNMEAFKDPNSANELLVFLADGLGIGANTYGATERNTEKLSKTMQAFKQQVGNDKFEAANISYEQRYDKWLTENLETIRSLENDEKQSTVTAAKTRIQKQIYKEYGFKPPKDKQASDTKKKLLEAAK